MTEYKTLSYGESFGYKGLINVKEFFMMMDKWFKDRGYDKVELWNFEEVYETGKQITFKFEPYKKISDFAKVEIRVQGVLKNLQEVVVEKNKLKIKIMKGEASFTFDVFLATDYEGYWGTKPIYFFLRTIADKFLYRSYLDRYEDIAVKDKEDLKREMKSFLNMHRY
jgi:hypothetical protein